MPPDIILHVLAQTTNAGLPQDATVLGQGIVATLITMLGGVLTWFMWRNEKKSDQVMETCKEMADAIRESSNNHSSTIDRLSAAMLAQTMVHPNLAEGAKPALEQMMADIKEADAKRKR